MNKDAGASAPRPAVMTLAKSIIGTRRLILRPLRESDAAAIFALFNDWDVMRWLVDAAVAVHARRCGELRARAQDPATTSPSSSSAITLTTG